MIVLKDTDTGFGSGEKKSIKKKKNEVERGGREIIKKVQVRLGGERRIPAEKKKKKIEKKNIQKKQNKTKHHHHQEEEKEGAKRACGGAAARFGFSSPGASERQRRGRAACGGPPVAAVPSPPRPRGASPGALSGLAPRPAPEAAALPLPAPRCRPGGALQPRSRRRSPAAPAPALPPPPAGAPRRQQGFGVREELPEHPRFGVGGTRKLGGGREMRVGGSGRGRLGSGSIRHQRGEGGRGSWAVPKSSKTARNLGVNRVAWLSGSAR